MKLDRTEFLWDRRGRAYQIDTDDEIKVIQEKEFERKSARKNALDVALDDMEDGYNYLEEIDGELFEVFKSPEFKIVRKAYLIGEDKNCTK